MNFPLCFFEFQVHSKKNWLDQTSRSYLHKVQCLLSHSCRGAAMERTVIFLGSVFFVFWLKNRETGSLVRPESFLPWVKWM